MDQKEKKTAIFFSDLFLLLVERPVALLGRVSVSFSGGGSIVAFHRRNRTKKNSSQRCQVATRVPLFQVALSLSVSTACSSRSDGRST